MLVSENKGGILKYEGNLIPDTREKYMTVRNQVNRNIIQ